MTTERIYLGASEDEAQVLRDLFAILTEERDQRLIQWVPGERAVDVPADVAEVYMVKDAVATKKPTKAAKVPPPPSDTKTEE